MKRQSYWYGCDCTDDIKIAFDIGGYIFENKQIVYAIFESGSYDGECWIAYFEDGKFYWDNSSHCSCNGFEGTWSPTEISLEELIRYWEKPSRGFEYGSDHGPKVLAVLESWKDEVPKEFK